MSVVPGPALRLACQVSRGIWRTTDLSTFRVIALDEQRRWYLYAEGLCSRVGTLETNSHTLYYPPRGIVYDLLALVGLVPYDDAYGL